MEAWTSDGSKPVGDSIRLHTTGKDTRNRSRHGEGSWTSREIVAFLHCVNSSSQIYTIIGCNRVEIVTIVLVIMSLCLSLNQRLFESEPPNSGEGICGTVEH